MKQDVQEETTVGETKEQFLVYIGVGMLRSHIYHKLKCVNYSYLVIFPRIEPVIWDSWIFQTLWSIWFSLRFYAQHLPFVQGGYN